MDNLVVLKAYSTRPGCWFLGAWYDTTFELQGDGKKHIDITSTRSSEQDVPFEVVAPEPRVHIKARDGANRRAVAVSSPKRAGSLSRQRKPKDQRFTTGKHVGEKFSDVRARDKGYGEWLRTHHDKFVDQVFTEYLGYLDAHSRDSD